MHLGTDVKCQRAQFKRIHMYINTAETIHQTGGYGFLIFHFLLLGYFQR